MKDAFVGDVGALEAGRETDALVAERVFGKPWPSVSVARWWTEDGRYCGPGGEWSERINDRLPAYSTDIAAAFEVVEKIRETCCDFTLERAGAAWYADFRMGVASADTAPLAICRAALAATSPQPEQRST